MARRRPLVAIEVAAPVPTVAGTAGAAVAQDPDVVGPTVGPGGLIRVD